MTPGNALADDFLSEICRNPPDIAAVQKLLAAGARLFDLSAAEMAALQPSSLHPYPLIAAVEAQIRAMKFRPVVTAMLEAGAPVNAVAPNGDTALLLACKRFSGPGVARELIAHGADIHYRDAEGWTPLVYALHCRNDAVAALLLDHGVSVEEKNGEGWTAVMLAAHYGALEILRSLVTSGADLCHRMPDGTSAYDCVMPHIDEPELKQFLHAAWSAQSKAECHKGLRAGIRLRAAPPVKLNK